MGTTIRLFVIAGTSAILSLVAALLKRWDLVAAMSIILMVFSLAGCVFIKEKEKEVPVWVFIVLPIILFIIAWSLNVPGGWF